MLGKQHFLSYWGCTIANILIYTLVSTMVYRKPPPSLQFTIQLLTNSKSMLVFATALTNYITLTRPHIRIFLLFLCIFFFFHEMTRQW
jgi:hypothetical protein